MRAVWLSRFEYCRYTSTHDQDSIRAYIADVIRNAAAANFNVLFFQIRGNGDAYYTPGLEPWGELLTGKAGQDPGWDPLQFALDSARAYGLELHAWLNTFPVWRGPKPPPDSIAPFPPYLRHQDWLVCDSAGVPMPLSDHYVSFSPGIPAVHSYLIELVSDITSRYDLDGIHFDYIRYPENASEAGYSHDSVSVSLFQSKVGNPLELDWADWQRNQLTTFVATMYNAIQVMNNTLKMSVATIGSYHRNGWNAYNAVYQDPRRWTELGKVDFVVPMIYWPLDHPSYGFSELAEEYRSLGMVERYLIPGIGSYKYHRDDSEYSWQEVEREIDFLRSHHFPGLAFFGSKSLTNHWTSLQYGRFRHPALIPAMTWKDSLAPAAPVLQLAVRTLQAVRLAWQSSPSRDVERYAIYLGPSLPVDSSRAGNILFLTPAADTAWQIPLAGYKAGYVAVSALDDAWNESSLSNPVFIGRSDVP